MRRTVLSGRFGGICPAYRTGVWMSFSITKKRGQGGSPHAACGKLNGFQNLNARKPIYRLGPVWVGEDHITPALTSHFRRPEVFSFSYDAPAPAGRKRCCELLLHRSSHIYPNG